MSYTEKMLRQGHVWSSMPVREYRRQEARRELRELLQLAVEPPTDANDELRRLLNMPAGREPVKAGR
jgi:hypothetical protein